MEKTKNVLIVAGEASGDLHASNLVRAVKNIYPQVNFFGLGGERLKQAGVNLYFNLVDLAVVGIFEVLKNLGQFRKIFNDLLREVDKTKPDLAILVDYPGFNLRLAQELKKRNIPVIYYISPQVWAWGKSRIKTIKECISRMIVVFKFEEELYRRNDIPVSFVGHPLLDTLEERLSKEEFLKRFNLAEKNLTIALLPGSREKEVKTLLPIMLEASRLIYKKTAKDINFIILRSSTVKEELFSRIIKGYNLPVQLVTDMTYEGLNASDFAMVASGTATLETALLGVPMVILYKVSFLTWLYIKMMIKIPYIGLVNVVKGEKFIEEFIQYNASAKKISDYIILLLENKDKLGKIKEGLIEVAEKLGKKGASRKAAGIIADFLKQPG